MAGTMASCAALACASVEYEVEWEGGSRAWMKQAGTHKFAAQHAAAAAAAGAGAGAAQANEAEGPPPAKRRRLYRRCHCAGGRGGVVSRRWRSRGGAAAPGGASRCEQQPGPAV
jgi:hypothetical protein